MWFLLGVEVDSRPVVLNLWDGELKDFHRDYQRPSENRYLSGDGGTCL